jgi:glucosamine-6-phosphate deaminase
MPLVLADPDRVAALAAELVANRLSARPSARLLLGTSSMAQGVYRALRARARAGGLGSQRATILQLDEYIGVGPSDPRSMAAQLSAAMEGVRYAALASIDGAAEDPRQEAARHEAAVEGGAIDLALIGLGRDGHVAFDEPPARVASGVRIVELADPTRRDAARAFGGMDQVPRRALTVGLGTLYRARELVLLVLGGAQAPALRAMLEHPVHADCPASLLRDHPRLTIVCDREAASALVRRPEWQSDRVLIVLGHRDPGSSPEHRISSESRARLRHALAIARATPVRAAILTGYTSAGGLSEAEQMKTAWDESEAPALLEVAGRNTAENAARSLPLVLALGECRDVTVVSSAWHLRVPWFFAPYRRFGLHVAYRASFAHGDWPRMLARELREARRAPAERRAAMAAVKRPSAGTAA